MEGKRGKKGKKKRKKESDNEWKGSSTEVKVWPVGKLLIYMCVCVREVWLIIKSKVFSFRRAEGHRHRQRKWKILKKQTDLLVYISMNYAAVQKVQ